MYIYTYIYTYTYTYTHVTCSQPLAPKQLRDGIVADKGVLTQGRAAAAAEGGGLDSCLKLRECYDVYEYVYYLHVYTYIYICDVYAYVYYLHVHTYIYICIYICIHTHV